MTLPIEWIEAAPRYRDAMAALFRRVAGKGDALPYTEDTSDALFDAMWTAPGVHSVLALVDGQLAGMYKMNANFPGRAGHVASGTYLVSPDMQGRGIGGAMLRDSLRRAGAAGFRSMQFNFVVSSNRPAVALYQKHGFSIVGTLPEAFLHSELGYVDAYVMSRPLDG